MKTRRGDGGIAIQLGSSIVRQVARLSNGLLLGPVPIPRFKIQILVCRGARRPGGDVAHRRPPVAVDVEDDPVNNKDTDPDKMIFDHLSSNRRAKDKGEIIFDREGFRIGAEVEI